MTADRQRARQLARQLAEWVRRCDECSTLHAANAHAVFAEAEAAGRTKDLVDALLAGWDYIP